MKNSPWWSKIVKKEFCPKHLRPMKLPSVFETCLLLRSQQPVKGSEGEFLVSPERLWCTQTLKRCGGNRTGQDPSAACCHEQERKKDWKKAPYPVSDDTRPPSVCQKLLSLHLLARHCLQ